MEGELNVAESIRDRRQELGLTQSELAQRSGLRQGHVSQIENGTRRPSLGTLMKLRAALDLSDDQFHTMLEGAA